VTHGHKKHVEEDFKQVADYDDNASNQLMDETTYNMTFGVMPRNHRKSLYRFVVADEGRE